MTTEGANVLGPKGLEFLEKRGLDPELAAVKLGIHTGRFSDGKVEPSGAASANIIVYPVRGRDGARLYDKYRGLPKKFWRESGTEDIPAVFYGAEVFADEGLYREIEPLPLVIVEGYEDRIVGMMAGFPATVSVPDGAPPPQKRSKDEPLDDSQNAKFQFMANAEKDLARVRWFIIAVDDDAPGRALRDEIVHRVGAARCAVVEYPDGCKDLSDVLAKHGLAECERILKAAKPHPVKGLYKLDDYPDKPPVQTFSAGIASLDRHFQIFPGAVVVMTGIPSHGKALSLDTKIPTPRGWVTMAELVVGDTIYDEMGKPCRVVAATPEMVGRPCFRLRFNDGTEIVADAEHQWLTTSEPARRSALMAKKRGRDNPRPLRPNGSDQTHKRTFSSVVTTAQISQSLRSQGKWNHQVKLAGAVEGVPVCLPISPYVLGAWLGDGNCDSGAFTCFDGEIVERLVASGYTVSAQNTPGRYTIRSLVQKLRAAGLLRDKRIPRIYQRATVSERRELLMGLMDTDGSCRPRDRVCEFTSINEALARDVYELVCGLGFKASFLTGDAMLCGRRVSAKYRVCFIADEPVFTVRRKISAQRLGAKRRNRDRTIVACEPVDSVPVRCIQVDSPSRLFLASEAFIPTHNSTLVDQLCVNYAELHEWPCAVITPEMPVVPHTRDKLRRQIIRGPLRDELGRPIAKPEQIEYADKFINRFFTFIEPDPLDGEDDELSLEWVLDKAGEALLRYGIRLLVIDPWNELEHAINMRETEERYTNRALRNLRRWAVARDVAVILLAHPTKEVGKDGKARRPNLYDIAGSAHWYNKPDAGLIVHRPDENMTISEVRIAKVRHRETGKKGTINLSFNIGSERYYDPDDGPQEVLV